MSARNHGSGFRLRLFDETGMPTELRNNLYWLIWAVTAGMLGTVVTTGAGWSAFQRQVLGANAFSSADLGHSLCGSGAAVFVTTS
jgi:hypothetical protein